METSIIIKLVKAGDVRRARVNSNISYHNLRQMVVAHFGDTAATVPLLFLDDENELCT